MRFLRRLFVKRPAVIRVTPPQGSVYNLQAIYDEINGAYFESKLTLKISWCGSAGRAARVKRRLGCYDSRTGLIKIHRLLDHSSFPSYFIHYIVYHEMLHAVCPPRKGRRGRRQVHHREFKEREKGFREYALAKQYEKDNFRRFFHGRA